MSQVSGTISQATGTFFNVNSGITEQGQVDGTGSQVANAFSLQLNSNVFYNSPACSGSTAPADCQAWQQFLYLYNSSQSQILMQYWLIEYGPTCPANWNSYPAKNPDDCWINSQAADVSTLTASQLANVQLSGMAVPGGRDEVSMTISTGQATSMSASDSMLHLAANWNQTQWGVYGDANSGQANFGSGTSLEATTSFVASTGAAAPQCVAGNTTGETNNLNLAATPNPGIGPLPSITSEQTSASGGSASCAAEPGYQPGPAYGLAADGLTGTWQAQSDSGSTGSPQPLPTTTGDCGNWSGADGTQVVGLSNGDNLWSFGDTYLGPAVARQDFFNNGFIHNSMVLQAGSAFTTITGGTGCASGKPTTATAPVTSPDGAVLWPASSIVYGSDVEKFYYTVNSDLVQQQPEVAEIPQASLESGSTYSKQAVVLDGCASNPIMWGAATIASGGYTYIYGSQQFSGSGGNTGGEGGELYLARSASDPSDQATWQYYTASGWSQAGVSCEGVVLAALGGSEPIEVPTEFSVTSVGGDFWLVDQDPDNGDQGGWAVAHESLTPQGFSNDPAYAVVLFDPTQTSVSGINDSVPGLIHYAVRMLEPSAVTPTNSGDVVIAYNVNDSELDAGCIALDDYDANAYRPRFIDVPTSDLSTVLNSQAGNPAAAAGRAAQPAQRTEPQPVTLSPQVMARGQAQLKMTTRARSQAAAATSWTYNPDAVPGTTTWTGSCPSAYAAVDQNIAFSQNPDGSLEVSWPNQGPDVWYWFHWQDVTSYPGTWNTNEFWTEGPNADGYLVAPPAGAQASNVATISQLFTLPANTLPGDKFSFWVQAFAAGNGSVISPDSTATAVSHTPTSPTETVAGLTAVPGIDEATLNWTAVPKPITGQAIWYSVRYKLKSGSTWTYASNYITNTADMTPLAGGSQYEFEVAVTDYETQLAKSSTTWSAPVYATPKT